MLLTLTISLSNLDLWIQASVLLSLTQFDWSILSRWKNWTVRFIFGLMMIFAFIGIIYLGPLALVLLVRIDIATVFNQQISSHCFGMFQISISVPLALCPSTCR